ncbi:MAG: flagellar motor switch protein FliM [Lawsonibacter sp.]|nr:flagellar motor switch protein FliM [Lawsonibacter sp.]
MSEVLSQSQIDALLSAFNSGGDQPPEEKAPEKKYRKYDFSSPRKFTKDRIKMLNGIFENYSRLISSRLNGLLRINCEVSLESIEEQKYFEFSNALTEGDVLAIAEVDLKGNEDQPPVMFYLARHTALTMMDRMMGGEGSVGDEIPYDYTYTDLELQLYETLVEDMINVMGSSWENYIALKFTYTRTEVNPTLVQLLGLDETIVIVDMKILMEDSEGRMSLILPGTLLTNVFAQMSLENPGRKIHSEDNSEEIFDKLRDSSLEIVAQLGDTQLFLSDIYHLAVGDVVDLGRPKDAPIFLEIGGYQWFSGRIGTYKKNMAVKIDEVCYQAEQRSE